MEERDVFEEDVASKLMVELRSSFLAAEAELRRCGVNCSNVSSSKTRASQRHGFVNNAFDTVLHLNASRHVRIQCHRIVLAAVKIISIDLFRAFYIKQEHLNFRQMSLSLCLLF